MNFTFQTKTTNARRRGLLFLAALLSGFTGLLAACNTVEGAGKDIEKAGEGIQRAAD